MVNKLNSCDASYLAGLVDGEGSIRAKSRVDGFINVELAICMTDIEAVRWANLVTGVGKIWFKKEFREKRKDRWYWKVCRTEDVADIVRQIRPFLKIKHGQATAFLALAALRRDKRYPTAPSLHRDQEMVLAGIVTGLKHGRSRQEMYEEALDLAMYLRQAIEERSA